MRIARLAVLALVASLGASAAETKAPAALDVIPVRAASAHRGEAANYHAETGLAGYTYNVCAKHIDPKEPVGIFLFIPGQGARTEAPWFDQWEANTLRPFHLIGINMAWADGDNGKDTPGKLQAARIAIGQVCADYKVVLGRGVLAGFSGGGVPLGLWWSTQGDKGPALFPFTHVELWSTNFRASIPATPHATWFVSVGTKEWSLASLGQTQIAAFAQLAQDEKKDAVIDHGLMIPEKDHVILESEGAAGAAIFARSDVVLAPFVYEPDYAAHAQAARIAKAANAHALGEAAAALEKALADAKLADAERAPLADLQKRVVERMDAEAALIERLAGEDPTLAVAYGRMVVAHLGRDARAKAVSAALAKAAKDQARASAAHAAFIGLFPGLFAGGPTITAEQEKSLKAIAAALPATASEARMATAFAALPVTK